MIWLISLTIVFMCLAAVNYYRYLVACKAIYTIADAWLKCDIMIAKNNVDILIHNKVSNEVVNIFKKRYQCLIEEAAQEQDLMHVKTNVD